MATTKVLLKGSQKSSKGLFETDGPKMDLTLTYIDPASLKENFDDSRNQIAHKREENNQRRLKHEQRRRKYVRLLDASQMAYSRSFFENEVIGRVLTKANCEKEEQSLKKEVLAFKDIIALNRKNRDKRMEEIVASQGLHDIAWENVEAKREMQWNVFLDTNTQYRRREVTNNSRKFADQKDISGTIKDFLGKLLDGVDWVLTYREMTGIADHRSGSDAYSTATPPEQPVIPQLLWADIKHAIAYNGPFPKKLPALSPVLPSSLLVPFNVSERPCCAETAWLTERVFSGSYVFDQSKNHFKSTNEGNDSNLGAVSEGLEHEAGTSQMLLESSDSKLKTCSRNMAEDDWQKHVSHNIVEAIEMHHQSLSEAPTESVSQSAPQPEQDWHLTPAWLNSTPETHMLSESVIAVRNVTQPLPGEPDPVVDTRNIAMRIALFGSSFSLRHKMRDALVQCIPRLAVLSVEDMLTEIVAKSAHSSEITGDSELDNDIWSLLQRGEPVTDQHYVQLIMRAIQRIPPVNNGFVVVDFPNSREQCLLLMQAFSGIRYDQPRPQPSDYLSPYAAHDTAVLWQYSIDRAGLDVLLCTDYPLPASNLQDGEAVTTSEAAVLTPQQEQEREQSLVERLIQDITHRRTNMYTQEEVMLYPAQSSSVRHVCQVEDPAHPPVMVGVDATFSRREVQAITQLATYLHAYEDIVTSEAGVTASPGNEREVLSGMNAAQISEWCQQKAESLRDRYIPPERWSEEFWQRQDIENAVEALTESPEVLPVIMEQCLSETTQDILDQAVALAEEDQMTASCETAGAGESEATAVANGSPSDEEVPTETQEGTAAPEYHFPPRSASHSDSQLLLPEHAAILNKLWTQGEVFSTVNGEDFFGALRDVRCEALQRNRCLLDTLQTFLLCDDQRQQYLSAFCQRFNDDIPDELRFDPDCVAELTLRTLILRDFFCKLSEQKTAEGQKMTQKWSQDGIVSVWQYRVNCEAAMLLQAELQRFYIGLDILFDTAKAYQGFSANIRVRNDLEPVLPTVIVDSAAGTDLAGKQGGKDAKKDAKAPAAAAGKGGKNDKNAGAGGGGVLGSMSQFVAYREAVAPMLLPVTQMTGKVPQPVEKETIEADAGKGKSKPPPKPKKGEEVNTGPFDPFAEMWKLVQEEMSKWQKGKFTVNRDLYYANDEVLCQAIERAVWYETEKFLFGGKIIETYVREHVSWLQQNENDLQELLQRILQDRCSRELRATQGVIDMIHHAIEEATSVGELWLVTSDAYPTINPETVWRPFSTVILSTELQAEYETPGGLSHHQKQRQVSFQKLRSSSMRLSFAQRAFGFGPGSSNNPPGGNLRQSRTMSLRGSMSGGFNRGDPRLGGEMDGTMVEESLPMTWQNTQRASLINFSAFQAKTQAMLQQRYRERFDIDRQELASRLALIRAQREEEYLHMGLTPTAAKLAAFNELLLDEQHQFADLHAKYAVYFDGNADDSKAPTVELRPQSRHAIIPEWESNGDGDGEGERDGMDMEPSPAVEDRMQVEEV